MAPRQASGGSADPFPVLFVCLSPCSVPQFSIWAVVVVALEASWLTLSESGSFHLSKWSSSETSGTALGWGWGVASPSCVSSC